MRKYDQEFKKATVKKYLDGQSVASIAREIGVNENTIHKWKSEIIQKDGEPDKEKLAMRKRIIELGNGERNSKKGGDYLRAAEVRRDTSLLMAKSKIIRLMLLCRVMQVKCCNYYAYRRGKTYRESPLAASIKECFNSNARRYGSRRIAIGIENRTQHGQKSIAK